MFQPPAADAIQPLSVVTGTWKIVFPPTLPPISRTIVNSRRQPPARLHWNARIALAPIAVRLGVIISLVAAGCDSGPKLVPASGTVTLKNKPIPAADVIFVPEAGGAPVIGRTDEQGQFSLTTDGKLGAYAGAYKVALTAVRQKREVDEAEAVTMTNAQIAANHESLIPIKFNNTISSGLTATVSDNPAENEFTFQLK